MMRTVALWLTNITLPLGCSRRARTRHGSARAAMAKALSPPGGDTSAGSCDHALYMSASLTLISLSLRPSHAP